MTTVEFPYCRSTPNSKQICNCDDPYVTVKLINAGFEITTEGLVDSGCTVTLVNADFAQALGVDILICHKTKVVGVGAVVDGYMTTIVFQVQGFEKSFNSQVIFVPDLPVSALLGQLDFFQHLMCIFKKRTTS